MYEITIEDSWFVKHEDKILLILVIIFYTIMTISLICYYCFDIRVEDVPILYRYLKNPIIK